jgi:hypothetical protein
MIRTLALASTLAFATAAWAADGAKPAADPAKPQANAAKPAVQIDKPHYAVTVDVPAGAPAQISMAPRGGFKINKAYPTKIMLKAGAGVTLPKTTLKKGDATSLEEKGASFPVRYTAAEAGGEVEATVKFSVCNAETCEMVKEKVAWKVVASAKSK